MLQTNYSQNFEGSCLIIRVFQPCSSRIKFNVDINNLSIRVPFGDTVTRVLTRSPIPIKLEFQTTTWKHTRPRTVPFRLARANVNTRDKLYTRFPPSSPLFHVSCVRSSKDICVYVSLKKQPGVDTLRIGDKHC